MKRYCTLICCLVMSALVLSLFGCGSSSSNNGGSSSTTDNLMVVSSPVLQKNGSYRLYRGDRVSVTSTNDANYNPMFYVAPVTGSDTVTMNLQFADALGNDQPFVITSAQDDNVLFYYNPNGISTDQDTTTAYGNVIRTGGGTQQLSYSGLTVTASAIDLEGSSEEYTIVMSGDTAQVDGTSVNSYNYAWHADPNHRDEYYTLTLNSSTELTESEMMANITPVKGVYINRDIRYMPNTISFTGTAKNDEDTEYVAYYSEAVQAEVAAELGSGFEGPYIFATLPQSAGNGGMNGPGGNGGMNGPGGNRGPNGAGEQITPADPRMSPNDDPSIVRGADVSNSDIAAFSTMTHSPEDAYNNPVLHIVEPGVYRLQGTWNGQIWIEVGEDEEDKVALILDNVTVTCGVAPALVFKEVYECGPDDEDDAASAWRTLGSEVTGNAGALVVIASGSTNNFTGANVYRMLKAQKKKDSVTAIDGTDVSQQKKRYKMDGAFYSFVSMAIGAESNTNQGTLNITSTTYEGLDAELHLTIDSGVVNVTAEDDGINVNEDDVSVFTLDGGSLTVTAKGGDGIDSNGWIVLNDGTLDVTAAQDSDQLNAGADGPLDADKEVYKSDSVTYTHRAYSGSSNTTPTTPDNGNSGDTSSDNTSTDTTTTKPEINVTDSNGNTVMSITYSSPAKDTETTDRGIDSSGNVFTLTHTVNDFSGIK